ncbi:MAG TPA: hypothetical protein VFM70_10075 [Salinimicrobium sp.]|nr:hypothetical protein [Salinimicrobium sp.]
MKTLVLILLGLIALIAIILMVVWEILELAVGGVFLLIALLIIWWIYTKIKKKLD